MVPTDLLDVTGASTRLHPAPFPLEIPLRLIRMFSFVGDCVLDPFVGTGTTVLAAARSGRRAVGVDIEPRFLQMAQAKLAGESRSAPEPSGALAD